MNIGGVGREKLLCPVCNSILSVLPRIEEDNEIKIDIFCEFCGEYSLTIYTGISVNDLEVLRTPFVKEMKVVPEFEEEEEEEYEEEYEEEETVAENKITLLKKFLSEVTELNGDLFITFSRRPSAKKKKQIEQITLSACNVSEDSEYKPDLFWYDEKTFIGGELIDYVTYVRKEVYEKEKIFPLLEKIQEIAEIEKISFTLVTAPLNWFLKNFNTIEEFFGYTELTFKKKLRKKEKEDVLKALTEYKDIIEEISPKSISFQEASHELIKLFEKINETIPIDQVTTGISINLSKIIS